MEHDSPISSRKQTSTRDSHVRVYQTPSIGLRFTLSRGNGSSAAALE